MRVIVCFANAALISLTLLFAAYASLPAVAGPDALSVVGGTGNKNRAGLVICPAQCTSGNYIDKCCSGWNDDDNCVIDTSNKPCGTAQNCGNFPGGTYVHEDAGYIAATRKCSPTP
jgi:hypothetical protein